MANIETSLLGFERGERKDLLFRAQDSLSGDQLETDYAHASEEEIARACELASKASLSMASLSGRDKAHFLRNLADRLDSLVEELVAIMPRETGLPEPRVRAETGRTSGQLRMFAALLEKGNWVDARIDRAQPDRQPLPKPDLRAMLRPVGPVAVFCASNFPLAFSVAGGDSASAWAAGCPVIVKAHHAHPGTALLVGLAVRESIRACNLPEGVFSLLYGSGSTVGRTLVTHPVIRAVGFTGSRSGGRSLFDLANARPEPIPVFAEMSSVNPIFVLPGMAQNQLDEFVTGLSASATLGVGQFCTNPGIVFHPGGDFGSRLTDRYREKMQHIGNGPMLHEGIRESYDKGLDRLSASEGVQVVLRSADGAGCMAGPCILKTNLEDFLKNPTMHEEVFGPSTLLVSYENSSDLIEVPDALEGQLTASLFGSLDDLDTHATLLERLETLAGRLIFNQFPTGVEVCGAVVHGGPFPATTDGRSTSVGEGAILRFARPVCYQGFPDDLLPDELKEANPLALSRSES
ncbi:MAG: aldehyde dehydrogenase (NADP(+)) [Opitutales bacterium]